MTNALITWNAGPGTIMTNADPQLGGIIDRAIEINGSRDGFSGSIPPRLRIKDERVIIFGAHKDPGDEQSFQGQPYDLKVLDEAAQHRAQVEKDSAARNPPAQPLPHRTSATP